MVELRRITACCLLLCAALNASAQELSYDGNRWYDVEISIFTNDVPGGTRSEIPVARKLTAAYLPRLRELTTRASVFMIDFPEDPQPAVFPSTPEVVPDVQPVVMGPLYSPAIRDSFKITDFDHDAFVDLGARAAQFTSMNRNIDGAADHRLLWHKVWRQPMFGRAQTEAVFVNGGELRGDHYELEGSLRVVANGNGAMLDINIWLNEFQPGIASVGAAPALQDAQQNDEWQIPALPFPPEESNDVQPPTQTFAPTPTATPLQTQAWQLAAVWQLAQTRELGANQLYYLDHPAIGVLIQVRPYVLPPRLPADGQEDF